MNNFWNSLKAPIPANQNVARVNSHIGRFIKIRWELGQKPPKTEIYTDKSGCIL